MPRKKSATIQLKVRMKEPLRAKIEAAAKSRGVSLNTEAVHRLQESFQTERAEEDKSAAVEAAVLNGVYEALGGREHYPLLVMVGNAARMVEAGSGERWLQDFETAAQVKNAITTIIDAFSPKPGTEAERVFGGMRGAETGMQVVRLAEEVGLVTTRTDQSNQKD